MQTSTLIATFATVLNLLGYYVYFIQIKSDKSKPNATSWALWVLLGAVNTLLYEDLSGEIVSTLIFIADTLACTIIFFYVWAKGRFEQLKWTDWSLLLLGIFAVIIWQKTSNPVLANIVVVLAFIISFIPTLKDVWAKPENEAPASWLICTSAYILTTVSVVVSKDSNPSELLAPIVLLLLHAGVAALCKRKFFTVKTFIIWKVPTAAS